MQYKINDKAEKSKTTGNIMTEDYGAVKRRYTLDLLTIIDRSCVTQCL